MPATKYARISLILWNILNSYGIDPEPLFWEAGINPDLMKQSGKRYRVRKVKSLWQKASAAIGDPCFGLKAAELWHPSNFSALGYAMLASNTIRTALQRMERYYQVISDEKVLELNEVKDGLQLTLVFSHMMHDIPERNDASLAVIMSICRVNSLEDFAPVSVTLTHPKPSCSSKFFEYFKCPVIFNAPSNTLTLPHDRVDRTLPGSNPQLAELNDQLMITYLQKLDQDDITQKVKAIVINQLPSGNVTDESVAKAIYMSNRTLQRKLEKAGTTFKNLLNETRQDLAKQYLRDRDSSMTEIAFLLGFSENSTFSRAFKRWTGVSPSEYRKAS
jgi:AraC-like DNA-binding protein